MKIGSLFAGIGGFDLAARWIGWETAWFSEIEPYCCEVLKKHWPDVPNHGDISLIDFTTVEPVDMLCGGFPCQDISLAGKGAGLHGERSGLWSHYRRAIETLRPSWVVVENVSALRSRGLDTILGEIAALGYDAEWHCIPASSIGAPHRRDRIWIIAHPAGWFDEPVCTAFSNADGAGSYARALPDVHRGEAREGSRDGESERRSSARRPRAVGGSVVADSHSQRFSEWKKRNGESQSGQQSPCRDDFLRCNSNVADTDSGERSTPNATTGPDPCWWLVEPNVGRVAHGVPARVDRLKSLGNAIVPQVAYTIFQAIKYVA